MASTEMRPTGVRADVRRLLLAKSILSSGRATSAAQPNDHLVAKHVLNARDAADLAFAAILNQKGKLPTGDSFMMQNLKLIETTAEKHVAYFKGLNTARNGLKLDSKCLKPRLPNNYGS